MIVSYACKDTADLYITMKSRRWRSIERVALRKLVYLNGVVALEGLRSPPGNRLEALVGDRAGQYSIRVNDQWRICFRWDAGNAHDVEIVDYH